MLIERSQNYSFNMEKPRFGDGRYMTDAVTRDYRVEGEKGRINVLRTMKGLKIAEKFLKSQVFNSRWI